MRAQRERNSFVATTCRREAWIAAYDSAAEWWMRSINFRVDSTMSFDDAIHGAAGSLTWIT